MDNAIVKGLKDLLLLDNYRTTNPVLEDVKIDFPAADLLFFCSLSLLRNSARLKTLRFDVCPEESAKTKHKNSKSASAKVA